MLTVDYIHILLLIPEAKYYLYPPAYENDYHDLDGVDRTFNFPFINKPFVENVRQKMCS